MACFVVCRVHRTPTTTQTARIGKDFFQPQQQQPFRNSNQLTVSAWLRGGSSGLPLLRAVARVQAPGGGFVTAKLGSVETRSSSRCLSHLLQLRCAPSFSA